MSQGSFGKPIQRTLAEILLQLQIPIVGIKAPEPCKELGGGTNQMVHRSMKRMEIAHPSTSG